MKRRDFVRNTFVLAGGFIVSPSALTAMPFGKKERKITILHTNDTHSNIDPLPSNHPKFPGMGGVERRSAIINSIRDTEENVLVLDAGDIFQGTPYFNLFGGILEMKVMSAMGYDVATIGNHDFDGGLEGFLKASEYAQFPFVCSNYDFSGTILKDRTVPSVVIEKGGLKIGILGVGIELRGLVPQEKYGNTIFLDPIACANREAAALKKKGCELIICLSHLGYSYKDEKVSDLQLARCSRDIHLIIGGHTHTFLDRPTEETNLDGQTVLINQVGWGGIQLGRLDFLIEEKIFSRKDSLRVQ